MDGTAAFDRVLAAAQDGSPRAFTELWRLLNPPLVRYLRIARPDDADDLASETWLQVARDIRRFRGDEGAFRRWFFTIARHRVLDHARRSRRDRAVPVPNEAFASVPDPADPAEEGASIRAALGLIRTLPPAQAEAIALRVVAGLSVPDVARVLGKRSGAVRVLVSRGLRELAIRLSAESPQEPAGRAPGARSARR